jgi:hypothetical protein
LFTDAKDTKEEEDERFMIASSNSTISNVTNSTWNIVEASALIYFMDHICEPQTSMRASFKVFSAESVYNSLEYMDYLQSLNITDDADFYQRKVVSRIKTVITITIIGFFPCENK